MKVFLKKSIVLFLAVITALLALSVAVIAQEEDNYVIKDEDALCTHGDIIINKKGEEVMLRGLNLGGWLIHEDWFCPINSLYDGKKGNLNTIRIFEERFGTEKAYELFDIYQDNFIVETDFMNIAAMGFNCVRIPFWYRNFQSDDNGTWILDENGEIDLSRLEWAVDMCRKYGLYAILDLHAANGVQGKADHAGLTKSYHFFDRNEKGEWYRQQAVEIWKVIAERFKGDPAVAMFDLLNEPMCDTNALERIHKYIWEYYDMAYDAIRAIDPDRMITMIGTWSVDKLPNPTKYGWENVVYQYHQYDKNDSDYTNRIKAGFDCNYNVPQYAGEFHPKNGKATLDFAIGAYDSNNISWTLWTYKGYNSWACYSDWFAYGSNTTDLIVDPLNDSYETIAYKWGEQMQTNSGNFHPGKLYNVAKKYLPVEPLEALPYKNQYDIDHYVPGELVKGGKVTVPVSTTEAPTTEAPTTEAPTTEAPTTEAPTTEAPTTEAPTTEAPTTEAPTTEAPTTEAPTTEAPTTEAPTTEAPTTEAPTTEAPEETSSIEEEPSSETPITKPSYMLGDINNDGKITAVDSRIILRIAIRLEMIEDYPNAILIADINGDGKITAVDARKVLRISVKLEEI